MGSQPPSRLRISKKDSLRPRRKEARHYPWDDILLMEEYGDSEENPPQQRGERPIPSKANNHPWAHLENNPKGLGERDGKLSYGHEGPVHPPRALARPRDPAHTDGIELNPRIPRHHRHLQPIAAPHVDEPGIRLGAMEPFKRSEGGIEMAPRPAPTDEKRPHAIPSARY